MFTDSVQEARLTWERLGGKRFFNNVAVALLTMRFGIGSLAETSVVLDRFGGSLPGSDARSK